MGFKYCELNSAQHNSSWWLKNSSNCWLKILAKVSLLHVYRHACSSWLGSWLWPLIVTKWISRWRSVSVTWVCKRFDWQCLANYAFIILCSCCDYWLLMFVPPTPLLIHLQRKSSVHGVWDACPWSTMPYYVSCKKGQQWMSASSISASSANEYHHSCKQIYELLYSLTILGMQKGHEFLREEDTLLLQLLQNWFMVIY